MFIKTYNIPIELCSYALSKKRVRALQVYVYLKLKCSGKIMIDQQFLKKIANDLELKSIKTIKIIIAELINEQWISKSEKSGYYFVKSFERIRRFLNLRKRTAAEVSINDIKNFKAFLIAAIISHLINAQKRRLRAVERTKGSSKTSAFKQSFFYPVANAALAKILGISVSTAFEWKRLAEKQGYIIIRNNSSVIEQAQPQFLKDLKKYGDIPGKRIWVKKGKVCEQLPDNVYSKVSLRRRRKLEVF